MSGLDDDGVFLSRPGGAQLHIFTKDGEVCAALQHHGAGVPVVPETMADWGLVYVSALPDECRIQEADEGGPAVLFMGLDETMFPLPDNQAELVRAFLGRVRAGSDA